MQERLDSAKEDLEMYEKRIVGLKKIQEAIRGEECFTVEEQAHIDGQIETLYASIADTQRDIMEKTELIENTLKRSKKFLERREEVLNRVFSLNEVSSTCQDIMHIFATEHNDLKKVLETEDE